MRTMMKALIDSDILSYEISSCGQYYDIEDLAKEHLIIREFDYIAGLLDQKIKEIVAETDSDSFVLYLTGDEHLLKHVNRRAKFLGEDIKVFKPNFRHGVAKAKPYKGNRKQEKPYHFHNLRAYMLGAYECIVTEGMEADDLICTDLYKSGNTSIACSRDKDLRMCPGYHYGWACGKQEQFGPEWVDVIGQINLSTGSPKKLKGTGLKFFYSQLITGDVVDNISGLPKRGPVFAYNLLCNCTSEYEMYECVRHAYHDHYGDSYEAELREQVDLLWMIREINEDGSLKFYEYPGGAPSLDQQDPLQDVEASGLKQSLEAL